MQVSKSLLIVCTMALCAGVISIRAQDTPAQAAARAALEQSMEEPAAAAPAAHATQPPAAPAAVAPAAASAPMAAQPMDNEAQAKAREALLQQMDQPAATDVAPAKKSGANTTGNGSGFAPIVAPPLPISAAKKQQLDALLVQYKADQISSEEYQKQRAAILAQPDATSH